VISYLTGNLFESPAQTLVNTVNTEGVMGKGIALQFKQFYPEMFTAYQRLCEEGTLKIGTLQVFPTPHKIILNFPTKTTWRKPSRPEYIEAGLQTFRDNYQKAGIHSVAFPPLGCGNGELAYDDVRPLMEQYLHDLPIPVYLYPPQPRSTVAEHRRPEDIRSWLRHEPRSLPFGEVWNDLIALLSTPRSFETLSKRTPFTAEFIEAETDPHIRVRAAGKTSAYGVEEVKMVWRDLRAHGVATSRSLDARDTAHLFPILAELPYIEVIRIADSYEKFSFNKAFGLQLVPEPIRSQRSLAIG
jgi:O-acetyl-ADP-ribose deacetylase (regulator of RNase III)